MELAVLVHAFVRGRNLADVMCVGCRSTVSSRARQQLAAITRGGSVCYHWTVTIHCYQAHATFTLSGHFIHRIIFASLSSSLRCVYVSMCYCNCSCLDIFFPVACASRGRYFGLASCTTTVYTDSECCFTAWQDYYLNDALCFLVYVW